MTLAFFLPCVPPTTTHQRKRIIRIGKFTRLGDSPELQATRAMLEELLLPHQPAAPVRGAVVLSLEFTWPWLASTPKRVRAEFERVPKTTKPDCSNLAKTLEDRLAALRFIEDDALVAALHVSKWLGDTPGIHVDIAPIAAPGLRRPEPFPAPRVEAAAPLLEEVGL